MIMVTNGKSNFGETIFRKFAKCSPHIYNLNLKVSDDLVDYTQTIR